MDSRTLQLTGLEQERLGCSHPLHLHTQQGITIRAPKDRVQSKAELKLDLNENVPIFHDIRDYCHRLTVPATIPVHAYVAEGIGVLPL